MRHTTSIERRIARLTLWALLWTAPALAHHSFATQYDVTRPIEMKGTVTKVEWTNPHARLYIDVKDETGATVNWNFEMASPNILVRNGWKQNTVAVGDRITISGYLARKGERMAIAGAVADANGKALFADPQTEPGR